MLSPDTAAWDGRCCGCAGSGRTGANSTGEVNHSTAQAVPRRVNASVPSSVIPSTHISSAPVTSEAISSGLRLSSGTVADSVRRTESSPGQRSDTAKRSSVRAAESSVHPLRGCIPASCGASTAPYSIVRTRSSRQISSRSGLNARACRHVLDSSMRLGKALWRVLE